MRSFGRHKSTSNRSPLKALKSITTICWKNRFVEFIPLQALNVMAKIETDLNKTKTHQENLIKAKDGLGLEHTAESSALSEGLEELTDLKSVSEAVSKPYYQL
jgi:hypothetical protein